MAASASANPASGEARLSGGNFYGSVLRKQAVGGGIFTELLHGQARKLPAHSHELPFFCLVLGGDYAEKYMHRDVQFRPFTFSFRPAGVPHQDEIGQRGARMFGIEVQRDWQQSLRDCSGSLGIAYDFEGGELLWLALTLYFEMRSRLDVPICTWKACCRSCWLALPADLTAPSWRLSGCGAFVSS